MTAAAGTDRWRIVVHALDRTGPPMLALTLVRWLRAVHPDEPVELVAFRGGPLATEAEALAPTTVLLDDEEPWDHAAPDPARRAALAARLAGRSPARTLLVSVAASQVLPLLDPACGPVACWSVEVGRDLHWLDAPVGLRERVAVWLAGSAGTARELGERLGGPPPPIVPEFVAAGRSVAPTEVARARAEAGVPAGGALVLGVGIGTRRKGIDLFAEAGVLAPDALGPGTRYLWIGGERDPLHPRVRAETEALGATHVSVRASVPDLAPWFAAADVLLHTARLDAFPLVALHAVEAGTPVVAFSGAGGVEEMLGQAFLGVPFPDVRGLTSVLTGLADPDRRRTAAASQHPRVVPRHLVDGAGPLLRRAMRERLALSPSDD